jgi:hypothetical protein
MGLKWYSWTGLVKTYSANYSKENFNCPVYFLQAFEVFEALHTESIRICRFYHECR